MSDEINENVVDEDESQPFPGIEDVEIMEDVDAPKEDFDDKVEDEDALFEALENEIDAEAEEMWHEDEEAEETKFIEEEEVYQDENSFLNQLRQLKRKDIDIDQFIPDSAPRISGDFSVRADMNVVQKRSAGVRIGSTDEDVIEESETIEEEELEVEEDKDAIIEQYYHLVDDRREILRRNAIFHEFMTRYCLRRRLMQYFIETDDADDTNINEKYNRKLMTLHKRLIMCKKKKDQELEFTRRVLLQMVEDDEGLKACTDAFIKAEQDFASRARSTTSGKPISEKHLNQIINLQRRRLEEIGELRLRCIRIRNRVASQEASLKCVETLGDNLRLVDFQQLRVENQNYSNRLEEREDECAQYHEKCGYYIQSVAHIREKSYVHVLEAKQVKDRNKLLDAELSKKREELNKLKVERDSYRISTTKLREKSGLVMETKLLQHFEITTKMVEAERKSLEKLRDIYNQDQRLYDRIREFLESHEKDNVPSKEPKPLTQVSLKKPQYGLYAPEIPKNRSSDVIRSIVK